MTDHARAGAGPVTVKVTFDYTPDEPDPEDSTGMSSEEYERLTDSLMQEHGAENIEIRQEGA